MELLQLRNISYSEYRNVSKFLEVSITQTYPIFFLCNQYECLRFRKRHEKRHFWLNKTGRLVYHRLCSQLHIMKSKILQVNHHLRVRNALEVFIIIHTSVIKICAWICKWISWSWFWFGSPWLNFRVWY